MSFIKNFTEKLLENEYRLVPGFYDTQTVGDSTLYMGFIKQVGAVKYGVTIINADRKANCTSFCENTVFPYFSQYDKVITVTVFVSSDPGEDILTYADRNIEDFSEDVLNIIWIADTNRKELIVKGNQPDKILNLRRLINGSFEDGDASAPQDISALYRKTNEKKKADIKSSNSMLTYILIGVNAVVLLAGILIKYLYGYDILDAGAISRDLILDGEWYRFLTHFFMHGGVLHFTANALSLYIFGGRTEKYFGKLNMILIYFLSGLGSGLLTILCTRNAAVGASGAIFGLMGAVLVYTRVKGRSADGLDIYLMIIFAVFGILSGFLMPGVDNYGHIGGFVTGIVIAALLLRGDLNGKIQQMLRRRQPEEVC